VARGIGVRQFWHRLAVVLGFSRAFTLIDRQQNAGGRWFAGRNSFPSDKTVFPPAPGRTDYRDPTDGNSPLLNGLSIFSREPSMRYSPCVHCTAPPSQEEYMIWVVLASVAGVWWYAWTNVRRRRKAKENTYVGA